MSYSPASIQFDRYGSPITTVSGTDGVRLGVNATISGSLPTTSDTSSAGTITGAGQTLAIAHNGVGVCAVQITGTWVGTLVFEATVNGTDWFSVLAYSTGSSSLPSSQTTLNYVGRVVCAGTASTRVRASAWTSGTASIALRSSSASSVARANITQNVYEATGNSSTTPLGSSGVFTGTADNSTAAMGIQVTLFTDQDSITNGLRIEQSPDGSNWDVVDTYTVLASTSFSRTVQAVGSFVRIVYTNGPVAQGVFRLQVLLAPIIEAVPRSLGRGGGLFIEPVEYPTFTVQALDVTLGNNKSLCSISLASGSPRVIRLREIFVRNTQSAAVTGVITTFQLRRFASHSAGTSLTPLTRDTQDALPAAVTVRTGATITGEAAAAEMHWEWSSDEWTTGTLDVEAFDHAFQNTFPLMVKRDPYTKPPTIRAGEGYHLKCITNTTAGTFDVIFVFTVEV